MPISNPIAFYDQAVKYTPVVPRVLELDNVDVPTAGQVYQLSAVPSDRPIIAVCNMYPGFPLSGFLSILCEPVSSPQTIPGLLTWSTAGETVCYYDSNSLVIERGRMLLAATTGQIFLQRSGDYFAERKTSLWTLGYFEGLSL